MKKPGSWLGATHLQGSAEQMMPGFLLAALFLRPALWTKRAATLSAEPLHSQSNTENGSADVAGGTLAPSTGKGSAFAVANGVLAPNIETGSTDVAGNELAPNMEKGSAAVGGGGSALNMEKGSAAVGGEGSAVRVRLLFR